MTRQTRREFLKWVSAVLAAVGPGQAAGAADETPMSAATSDRSAAANPFVFRLGLASYTTRELSLDETLKWAKRLGLTHVCLKDFHLPLNSTPPQFEDVKKKFAGAGLDFHAVGVVYMNTKEEVEAGFAYARNAGVRMIIGVPAFAQLDLVERKIAETGIALAIHNHGPIDPLYPTAAAAFKKIEGRDPRFGLCLDIGHSFRAGEDPLEAYRAFYSRILEIHLKDIDAAGAKGTTVEMGRGRIDHLPLLREIARSAYHGFLTFEYEKDGDNPVPGLSESVGYFRGLMRCL
jgi:inosose dehydratase